MGISYRFHLMVLSCPAVTVVLCVFTGCWPMAKQSPIHSNLSRLVARLVVGTLTYKNDLPKTTKKLVVIIFGVFSASHWRRQLSKYFVWEWLKSGSDESRSKPDEEDEDGRKKSKTYPKILSFFCFFGPLSPIHSSYISVRCTKWRC